MLDRANKTYIASDGSLWNYGYSRPPIPVRDYDWSAVHEDYDGAPDAFDDRHVYCPHEWQIPVSVERYIADNGEWEYGDRYKEPERLRLWRAAPDMLEALRAVRSDRDLDCGVRTKDAVCAAIAKATGEQ